ncbi:MAG: rRNA pseudouridine synthase [Clostridia bacterium]|nr:rRNA pseudouridine synthase [Clostridia bacterium]
MSWLCRTIAALIYAEVIQVERLDKILASQGAGTRSEVRKMIWAGRVTVDGELCRSIDRRLEPSEHEIAVNGVSVCYRKYLYIMMNKPEGAISASNDSHVRTVVDLLPPSLRRKGLFPVGRLDKDTTGLLIITDDGAFAHSVTSPGKKVFKTYRATLDGVLSEADMKYLSDGAVIDGGEICLPAQVAVLDQESFIYEIKIREGKYHQIKRMAQSVGRRVLALERTAVGALTLDPSLERGEAREMTERERSLPLTN